MVEIVGFGEERGASPGDASDGGVTEADAPEESKLGTPARAGKILPILSE